ncbi:MFS transporter [Fictibacillus sp. BK138]|uniref:MFS transporter n=1 Tax=Fictibacillus sp. BK138 TaxID=2512121 RepID=UPI001029AFF8|nr:MFS transporter [Fictibacillus sp. BK138]RZT15537.1 putative secreted protein with PEP-CTERM sorting signal [Fictibacillus sp. BK138]
MEAEKRMEKLETENLEPSVIKNPKFVVLWLASAFSSLAFSIYLTTEAWLVVDGMDLKVWLGIIMMMTTLPRVFLMVFGGVLADRQKRSQVLFILNLIRASLVFGLVVLLYAGSLNIWILAAFAFCFGILDAFFWPSSSSLLPAVIRKEQITRANSILQTTNQMTFMIAPAIAGFMMKFRSYEEAFALTGVLLLLSSFLVRNMNEETSKGSDRNEKRSVFQDLKEGFLYVRGIPFLIVTMCSSVVVNLLLVGPLNIGIPILVKDSLSGDALDLSYLESSIAIGMIIGAVLVGILNIRRKRSVISLFLIFLLGILCALFSQIDTLWQGLLILSAAGLCLSISNIISPSLTQELVETKMMGRVQSMMATSSAGLAPLSFALVSVLLSFEVSISHIMFVSCTLMALFSLMVLWRVRIVWTID